MDMPALEGLSSEAARRALARDGPNQIAVPRSHLVRIVLRTLAEPMIVLLLVACCIYLLLGELHEGLLLGFMVCMTVGVTLLQQGKAERALQALRELSSPRALVLRDGKPVRLPGAEVVHGDLLLVAEGERVAADAVLVRSQGMRIDESLLTGESWPVRKGVSTGSLPEAIPGGDDLPYLWSGTLVIEGEGIARVTATGPSTELGKLGRSLAELETAPSPLQRSVAGTVRWLAALAICMSLLVTLLYGLQRGEWIPALLAGIAVSMSLLPEELPVIMSIFPAIGAWRLSRAQVLTRRLAAIEALGCISVLCVDKTGTLTANRMCAEEMYAGGVTLRLDKEAKALPAPFEQLARFASLASKPRAFDPMETAFHALAGGVRNDEPLREYPLSAEMRAMSQVWMEPNGLATVAAKGAPESIAALCRMSESDVRQMHLVVEDMAARGLRVLAVAKAAHAGASLPVTQSGFEFHYLGLIALSDPLRKEVPHAVTQCRDAGVRLIMITGDYPATARSVATQAGFPCSRVLSGEEVDQLSDVALGRKLAAVSVCARIRPKQKLRIVQALKANGEIVGMTGDGVNDGPALKAADVGIAMGGRGSEVAREAAALVLLDDNFASIVNGIQMGRRIFANMRNAMTYVLAMHLPIAGMALLPILLGWPILLYPMHIAFIELIIDPACSLAFESEASEKDTMRTPPRRTQEALMDRRTVARALAQGAMVLLVVAGAYRWALWALPEESARAAAFAVLVLANLGLIFSNLSRRRGTFEELLSANPTSRWVAIAAMLLLAIVLYVPAVAQAFRFTSLSAMEVAVVATVGLFSMAGSDAVKWMERLRWPRRQ
jgi:Ca2+-transporting ATPase